MSKETILVVDDNSDLREALETALTNAGFTTVVAEDGVAGLEAALKYKPNLILLDIMMPNMNGHQMLGELRRDPWGKHAQVLFLTNLDDPKDIVESFERAGDDFIIKSNTSLKDIVTKVKQHLAGYVDHRSILRFSDASICYLLYTDRVSYGIFPLEYLVE